MGSTMTETGYMDLSPYIQEVKEFNKFKRSRGTTVGVYSCNYLTYIATLKCGSSFFTTTIRDNCRWPKITFDSINWDKSHVFSFMMEPKTRRYKAITQWLIDNRLGAEFLTNTELQKFVLNTPILDLHSYGYNYNYYEYCNKIDWIPVDVFSSTDQVNATVEKLFEKHLILRTDWAEKTKAGNVSNGFKISLAKKVKMLFEENPSTAILNYLAKDIELYNKVIARFNPDGLTWDEMSWLRK